MKAFNKFFALAAAICLSLAFTACSDSDDYTPAAAEANDQVYFSLDEPSTVQVSLQETSFDVPIYRVKTDDAITVPLSLTDSTGLYSIPSSVSFAAGESQTSIPVSYDPEKIVYDEFSTVTITIADDYATKYGLSSYTFQAGINSPYQPVDEAKTGGIGYFMDAFVGDGEYHRVEIYQNTEQPTVYRIMDPYGDMEGFDENRPEYIQIRLLQAGETFAGVTLTQSNLVYFQSYNTGYYNSKYSAYIKAYYPAVFTAYSTEDMWTHSCVTRYQDDGTPAIVQLAPAYYMDGVGGWASYSQEDGWVQIIFPGYVLSDYSLSCEYTGAQLNSAVGVGYASATITKGADLDKVVCVVIDGSADADEIAEGVAQGTVIGVEPGSDGSVSVPVPTNNPGYYKFLTVGIDEGEVVSTDVTPFIYRYDAYTAGTYTYGVVDLSGEDNPYISGSDETVLYKSDADDNAYAIFPWVDGGALMFTQDPETDVVTVANSWTNYVTSYGELFGIDLGAKYGSNYASYFDDASKTYHFRLGYMVTAGAYGFQEDTFTLTGESSGARSKAPKRINKVPFMFERPTITK